MLKASVIGLLILLILIIVYQYYKISEGFANSGPRITAFTRRNGIYTNIIAKTTDGSTIRGVNIVYNSTIPVLPPGGSTDSSIDLNLVVSPTEFLITNEPFNNMKDGYKYYFIQSPATKYTEGVTPLLGSFIYNRASEEQQSSSSTTAGTNNKPTGSVTSLPTIPESAIVTPNVTMQPLSTELSGRNANTESSPASIIPGVQAPSASEIAPNLTDTSKVAMNAQNKSKLLQDIQQIVRNECMNEKLMTTAKSQDILKTDKNKDKESDSGLCGSQIAEQQGREMAAKRPERPCPYDMNQYVRKDSIPCWGCTLDY